MADREPIAWITKGGKHIPIFDEGPSDDEKKKEREISENKKQADEKNKMLENKYLEPKQFSDKMKTINKLIDLKIKELNKADVQYIFGTTSNQLAEELKYLGCNVNRVHDLFNVKMPDSKFTRDEISKQKRLEKMY